MIGPRVANVIMRLLCGGGGASPHTPPPATRSVDLSLKVAKIYETIRRPKTKNPQKSILPKPDPNKSQVLLRVLQRMFREKIAAFSNESHSVPVLLKSERFGAERI